MICKDHSPACKGGRPSPGAQAGRPYQLRWRSGGSHVSSKRRQCPWAGEGGGRPQGLSLCPLGGRRGSGLRKSRSAAARQRKSSRRTYRIVWLRGSVSAYIQNCLSTWEPLSGAKKVVHSPLPPPPPPPPRCCSPTRTQLRALAYIPCTSRTIHSSTLSFLSAHQMTFRGTRSNAFTSTKAI